MDQSEWWDVHSEKGSMYVGTGSLWEAFGPSILLFCEPKTALKMKFINLKRRDVSKYDCRFNLQMVMFVSCTKLRMTRNKDRVGICP